MAKKTLTFAEGANQGLISSGIVAQQMSNLPRYFLKEDLSKSILSQLRVIDEQDAVESINWDLLPYGLPQDLIEQILYYRGTGCLFYLRANNQFYFLPYMGKGLDCYGRYTKVTPLTWRGNTGKDIPWIQDLELTPIYDVIPAEEWTPEMMDTCCVLFFDYTPQESQTILSRKFLNEPLLRTMSELIPFMRTAMANSVGIDGMKVMSEDEAGQVYQANDASIRAAIMGDKWIPIAGSPNLTSLQGSNALDAQQFLLSLQSLDNYRLSTHGLSAGGLFQKGSHMLQAEQSANSLGPSLILEDRVYQRQKGCEIADTLWPLAISAYASDLATNFDDNQDGTYDNFSGANEKYEPMKEDTNYGGNDL